MRDATDAERRLVARVASASPRVAAALDEHVHDHDGLVPIFFLGVDVGRIAVELFLHGGREELAELDALLAALEEEFATAPPEVDDAIHLGFLEHLADPQGWRFRERLGPRMRERVETMWPSR